MQLAPLVPPDLQVVEVLVDLPEPRVLQVTLVLMVRLVPQEVPEQQGRLVPRDPRVLEDPLVQPDPRVQPVQLDRRGQLVEEDQQGVQVQQDLQDLLE